MVGMCPRCESLQSSCGRHSMSAPAGYHNGVTDFGLPFKAWFQGCLDRGIPPLVASEFDLKYAPIVAQVRDETGEFLQVVFLRQATREEVETFAANLQLLVTDAALKNLWLLTMD